MIDTIDQQLKDWVTSTVAGTDVRMSRPPAKVDRPTVVLQLLEMAHAVPSRRDGPRPVELALHYLVTTSAKSIEEAHRLLGELSFAAIGDANLNIDLQPIPIDTWRALGMTPQPAFRIIAPIVRERVVDTPRITQPVQLRVSPLATVEGVVLGPGDVPIAQARVHVSGTTDVAYTDNQGRFYFRGMPASPVTKTLRVVARGIEQTVAKSFSTEEPVVIRFQPQEK